MDNFDLKKFLTENRLTANTQNSQKSPASNEPVIKERFEDFLKDDTITFKYVRHQIEPHTDGTGGYLEYVSTKQVGGYTLVLALGGEATTDSMGYLVDFKPILNYDENLQVKIVSSK